MSPFFTLCLPLLTAAALLTAGCKDQQIGSWLVKKEQHVAGSAPAGADAHAESRQSAATPNAASPLVWQAPAHWKPKAASAMRRASFDVPLADGSTADLSISSLGGAAGGVLSNVNRWRAQLGLAPLADAQLGANGERIAANGLTFVLVDIAGQTGGAQMRLLAAIVESGGDTWFFKLIGPAAGVAGEKAAYLEFLHTVKST